MGVSLELLAGLARCFPAATLDSPCPCPFLPGPTAADGPGLPDPSLSRLFTILINFPIAFASFSSSPFLAFPHPVAFTFALGRVPNSLASARARRSARVI